MTISRADIVAFLGRAVRDILEREEQAVPPEITEETPCLLYTSDAADA